MLDDWIETGVWVNPAWYSSHEYKSANTYDGIGPLSVCHWDDG